MSLVLAFAATNCGSATPLTAQDDPVVAEVQAVSQKVAAGFNAGKADEVAALFVEKAELIDENGVVHQGREEIQQLLAKFFEKFPGAKFSEQVESIRSVGPIVVKEGVRTITTADGAAQSNIRFISTFVKANDGWKLVSIRDFGSESIPTPGEQLQPLDWLIGDWINEGADARVKISYRWSDDKNFILGDFRVTDTEGNVHHSSQRIGWDPLIGRPRSWLFDSDGGFADGLWTQVDEGWLVNSTATLPDGTTGSATLKISPSGDSRFILSGMHRVVAGQLEGDFNITIVRQPPAAGK
jgi:uncharacterized protein (TIGR02246 family)